MAYSEKEIEEMFNTVIELISEGQSLKAILRSDDMPSNRTFYKWLNDCEDKINRYARATKIRADVIFDEMFEIADQTADDFEAVEIGDGITIEKPNIDHIQRARLRIDTRKWALSKMNPKKYGDKVDVTTDGQPIKQEPTTVTFINARKNKENE